MQGVERDEVRNDVSTQPLNFLRFAVGFASLKRPLMDRTTIYA
ncbi:hypothetical protein X755_10550 [Mesorhizobium sp. LNJC405B00]|nr:hypothetical protein X755_10550 [Mesorhizobium sp. LNJC405B00]ESZ59939.1 hypothetical protein X729_16820 [Mesorhizobium sp. L103C131B0]